MICFFPASNMGPVAAVCRKACAAHTQASHWREIRHIPLHDAAHCCASTSGQAIADCQCVRLQDWRFTTRGPTAGWASRSPASSGSLAALRSCSCPRYVFENWRYSVPCGCDLPPFSLQSSPLDLPYLSPSHRRSAEQHTLRVLSKLALQAALAQDFASQQLVSASPATWPSHLPHTCRWHKSFLHHADNGIGSPVGRSWFRAGAAGSLSFVPTSPDLGPDHL